MSGSAYESVCFKCGGVMDCYMDWKPHDVVQGECLRCGYCFYTLDGQLTLEEVNERREGLRLRPLKRLKKQRGEAA